MIEQTREHLRILSIFHYLVGGIGYLFSLFPIIHLIMGILMLSTPTLEVPTIQGSSSFEPSPSVVAEEAPAPTKSPDSPPAHSESFELHPEAPAAAASQFEFFPFQMVGLMFIIIPAIMILTGFALSTAIIIAGKRLSQYRSHTFCLVMAGLECLLMPFGTVLGVFTIIVLTKPEARQLFGLPALPSGNGSPPADGGNL